MAKGLCMREGFSAAEISLSAMDLPRIFILFHTHITNMLYKWRRPNY